MTTSREASSRSHKYLRLAKHFREQVRTGELKPGDRLPSFAQMQAEHGIGQGTLERAYSLLEEEKIIVREPKRGTFVAQFSKRQALGVVALACGRHTKDNPYYLQLLQGAQDAAFEAEVEILLMYDASSARLEKVDGVLSTGQDIRLSPTVPHVTMVRPREGVPCVLADDFGGAKAATEHLISLGHRCIAALLLGGVRPTEYVVSRRLEGYRTALQQAGIEPLRSWVRPLRDPWEVMQPFADLGRAKMERWLQEDWAQSGCTAVLAHNDETAIGVMQALQDAGLDVPRDVSVIGFDGTEIADHVRPRLSTVEVPLHEIGATAMRMLLNGQHSAAAEALASSAATCDNVHQILPTRLKVQGSTGEAPR